MKGSVAFCLLLLVSLASNAMPQTGDLHATYDLLPSIASARCQYTPADQACAGLSQTSEAQRSDGSSTIAQFPRRMPGPPSRPHRPPMAHPRADYPGMWMEPNARHVAIGALLGAGAGVALAVGTSSDPNRRIVGSLIYGGFGALIGAMVAHPFPSFHSRRRYAWPDEDDADQDASAAPQHPAKSPPAPKTTQETASAGTPGPLAASHE
jgi:hypothetical protein